MGLTSSRQKQQQQPATADDAEILKMIRSLMDKPKRALWIARDFNEQYGVSVYHKSGGRYIHQLLQDHPEIFVVTQPAKDVRYTFWALVEPLKTNNSSSPKATSPGSEPKSADSQTNKSSAVGTTEGGASTASTVSTEMTARPERKSRWANRTPEKKAKMAKTKAESKRALLEATTAWPWRQHLSESNSVVFLVDGDQRSNILPMLSGKGFDIVAFVGKGFGSGNMSLVPSDVRVVRAARQAPEAADHLITFYCGHMMQSWITSKTFVALISGDVAVSNPVVMLQEFGVQSCLFVAKKQNEIEELVDFVRQCCNIESRRDLGMGTGSSTSISTFVRRQNHTFPLPAVPKPVSGSAACQELDALNRRAASLLARERELDLVQASVWDKRTASLAALKQQIQDALDFVVPKPS